MGVHDLSWCYPGVALDAGHPFIRKGTIHARPCASEHDGRELTLAPGRPGIVVSDFDLKGHPDLRHWHCLKKRILVFHYETPEHAHMCRGNGQQYNSGQDPREDGRHKRYWHISCPLGRQVVFQTWRVWWMSSAPYTPRCSACSG
jgi:hypothetical protein